MKLTNPFSTSQTHKNLEIIRAMKFISFKIKQGWNIQSVFEKSCGSYGFHITRAAIEQLSK